MRIILILMLFTSLSCLSRAQEVATATGRAPNVSAYFNKDSLEALNQKTKSSKDKGFELWFRYAKKVNIIMGKDYAEWHIMQIIMNEDTDIINANKQVLIGLKIIPFNDTLHSYGGPDKNLHQPITPNWKQMSENIEHQYGEYYARRITLFVQTDYYSKRHEWNYFDKALAMYVNDYHDLLIPAQLNQDAWLIFQHSDNKKQLQSAIKWILQAINQNKKDPEMDRYMDTYANLLYKTGRNKEALEWEARALVMASEDMKETYKQNLEKMKNGLKTW